MADRNEIVSLPRDSAEDERSLRSAARAALARIRLRRALIRRGWWADGLTILVAALPALVSILVIVSLDGLRDLPDDPLIVSAAVLALMGVVTTTISVFFLGMTGIFMGIILVLTLPFAIPDFYRWFLRRRAELELDARGRVPPSWFQKSPNHRRALEDLADADRGLVFSPDRGLAPPRAGPPASCPHCGASLRAVGEGVRRCDHCEREVFTPLPGHPVELTEARRRLAAVREGGARPQSRRELWRWFVEAHGGDYFRARRWTRRALLAYVVAASVAELGKVVPQLRLLGFVGLVALALLALPAFALLVKTAYLWADLRFQRFRPGVRAYDRALVGEVVTVVANQGRIGLDAVAEHLGVSRRHLDGLLAELDRLGGAPILRDRQRDELVSLCAVEIDDESCPLCGGALIPAPRGQIVCERCGSVGTVARNHAAPYAPLAAS